ncbi:COG1361 family protein [Halorubrum vacuolatum]|uniref:Uncharacterized conserved protein n=1 Tax=Halorubrum vacuolatum TaxID=63740 RepID=A0A238UPJ6_HALVU|nr:hypothetical protein [Halorubrum vacuolatum]SNR24045.1 Uncharacterized conserved protein [Halorubrum vacuolatum]
MKPSARTAIALIGCLMLAVAVGAVTGVPDARITIDELDASPGEPVVGERLTVNATVANSAGSPAAANVDEVRLLDEDGVVRDTAASPGALSPGDDLDIAVQTRFSEPGERRLTLEVIAEEPDEDGEADETVRIEREIVVDVQPADIDVDIRARALADDELRPDDEDEGVDVGGIDGIIGGGGGGLDAGDAEEMREAMDSPVAVTVVNVGSVPAERVHVTAVGDPLGEASLVDGPVDLESTPFVVEDVAPGEERQVIVDLGPVDRRANVTLTATYDTAGPADGDAIDEGALVDRADALATERTVETTLAYPPRDGDPVVTDAEVTRLEGDDAGEEASIGIDATVGNVGDRSIESVVVSVDDGDGIVTPTPAGGEYFVGPVGDGEFVPFELETRANVTATETVPIRIEYTDRGVRYVETVEVDLADATGDGTGAGMTGTLGTAGGSGVLGAVGTTGGVALALVGVLGATAAGAVLRRRGEPNGTEGDESMKDPDGADGPKGPDSGDV